MPADSPTSEPSVRLVTEIPGPKSRELRSREDKFLAPGAQNFALLAGICVERASGSRVTDVDGNTFLDLIGGIGVNGLGHCHPRWVKAIQEQVEAYCVGSFTSEARVRFFERVARHLPGDGGYQVQLYSSGAEAVESALRLAKSHTGGYEFIGFWGGFHGKTMGVLGLMGSDFKHGLGPMVPGTHLVPYANCYRCPLKLEYPSCGIACADIARAQAKAATAGEVAALIVEPMQGTAGNVIPPKEFLRAMKSLAKELGALFISDEMITGFGRTGRFWGWEHSGAEPDLMTIGKQFGGGFPVSGVVARREIASAMPWAKPSGSSSSYGGNPLASAAAAAALEIIDEERLVDNSREVGEYFLGLLRPLEERFPFVGQVRGAGLFLAIELVKDKRTKEPLPGKVTSRIFKECLSRGLLTMSYAASFRIQPAMTFSRQEADEAAAILTEVFAAVEREGWWREA